MKSKTTYEQLKHDAMELLALNRAYFREGKSNPAALAEISSGLVNVKNAESIVTGIDNNSLNALTAIGRLPIKEQKQMLQLFKGELNAKTVRGD